jgi:hypothetical protein
MTKYALLIGINYKGKKFALKGCINDINAIKSLINSWGFEDKNIIIMTDASKNKGLIPIAFNINTQLNMFCSKLRPGDKAVIYYSGHGTRVIGKFGDKDCCLVPLDYEKVGMIKDEVIRYYMYKIPSGVNVLCGFDACNSGSVCDLKFNIYDTSYRKDITKKLRNFVSKEWQQRQIINNNSTYLETDANIVSLSGCADEQYSYELGKNGALTTSLLRVIKQLGTKINLDDFIQHIRGIILLWRLKQSPGLTTGKAMDLAISLEDFIVK